MHCRSSNAEILKLFIVGVERKLGSKVRAVKLTYLL